jgi:hypothetical protein
MWNISRIVINGLISGKAYKDANSRDMFEVDPLT